MKHRLGLVDTRDRADPPHYACRHSTLRGTSSRKLRWSAHPSELHRFGGAHDRAHNAAPLPAPRASRHFRAKRSSRIDCGKVHHVAPAAGASPFYRSRRMPSRQRDGPCRSGRHEHRRIRAAACGRQRRGTGSRGPGAFCSIKSDASCRWRALYHPVPLLRRAAARPANTRPPLRQAFNPLLAPLGAKSGSRGLLGSDWFCWRPL